MGRNLDSFQMSERVTTSTRLIKARARELRGMSSTEESDAGVNGVVAMEVAATVLLAPDADARF